MKCGDLSHEYLLFVKEPKNVLALLDELEKEKGYASAYEGEKWHYHQLAESEGERANRAEAKLEAAEKRIAELEAKLANPVLLPKTNGYWNEQEKAYEEAITLARRQIRLAGFRCEWDE
ncbi:ead/Ea22-like family protein [Salmonella enterica]|nr:ead/Ea22-like family protein [Salmonella enterica]